MLPWQTLVLGVSFKHLWEMWVNPFAGGIISRAVSASSVFWAGESIPDAM